MFSFSEKKVRNISIFFLAISVMLSYRNIYFSPLIILAMMVYFSTKGIQMFEDKVYIGTRLFFWILFSALLFYKMYSVERSSIEADKIERFIITISIISISIGTWLGDFFSKYIYIRLKFFINRLYSKSNFKTYKILKMENIEQKYFKKPGKKLGIQFYNIVLEVEGKAKKFLLEKELFEKLRNKKELKINLKKGILGMYYGVDMEE